MDGSSPWSHAASVDEIADVLRERILNGRIAPGAALPQAALAEDLSFGRAGVGEALRILGREGLVEEAGPGAAARVAANGADVLFAAFEVREVLDGLAARLAATHRGPALGRRCRAALERQQAAVEAGDREGYLQADVAFHLALVEGSANPVLLTQLSTLRSTSRSATVLALGHLRRAIDQHELILAAICCAQPDRAEAAARAHVRTTIDALQAHTDPHPEVLP
jgi:DNA-binding GntR family transcriptional regulator